MTVLLVKSLSAEQHFWRCKLNSFLFTKEFIRNASTKPQAQELEKCFHEQCRLNENCVEAAADSSKMNI